MLMIFSIIKKYMTRSHFWRDGKSLITWGIAWNFNQFVSIKLLNMQVKTGKQQSKIISVTFSVSTRNDEGN